MFALLIIASTGQITAAHAGFSASTGGNPGTASSDALEKIVDLLPGSAVQPGTSTPTTTGSDLSLAVSLGRIPDSRTINDVIRVVNTTSTTHTIDLTKLGNLGAVLGLEYSDGTTSKALSPSVTYQIRARTSANTAGAFGGTLRFADQNDPTFLRRDRPVVMDQAPLAATALSATRAPSPTVRITLNWTASISTGVAGYNVYRATAAGGPYSKINAGPVAATTYDDNSIAAGTRYYYFVRAVAAGVAPDLESPDSNVVNLRYGSSATAVRIPAGGSNTLNYVSLASQASVTGQVDVDSEALAGDVVSIRYTRGATIVVRTAILMAAGAQTVNVTGANLTAMTEGAVTLEAWVSSGADVSPIVTGGATKDTILPAAPNQAVIIPTVNNPANYVNLATRAAAGVQVSTAVAPVGTFEARLTSGAGTVFGTATAVAGNVNVTVDTTALADTAIGGLGVAARTIDLAGNPSVWFTGTAATRDTVIPAVPNFSNIDYQNRKGTADDRVTGSNGAVGALDQVKVFDYTDNTLYPALWLIANNNGNFGRININNAGSPRTLGFEVRDTAWNQRTRICRYYTSNGIGVPVTCP